MAGIHVYNRTKEDHGNSLHNYRIFRPTILGNPYTHIKDRTTKAQYVVSSREEAIERYSEYYDVMYGSNKDFTEAIDKIYEDYKAGNDVYLECYCGEGKCHGDVIAAKLRKKLVKEKLGK